MAHTGDADTRDGAAFADVRWLGVHDRLSADRKTLAVFEADGLPVGQQWLDAGEEAAASPEILARAAGRAAATRPNLPPGRISVVICTRDRADELRRCLASFGSQSVIPDEIVVVDNASVGTATREVVEAAPGVIYVREDRPGLDIARNSGALASTGDFVLYTDDDTELHPQWVERCVLAFDDAAVMAMTGLVLPASLKTEAQWLFEDQWSFGRGFERIDYGPAFYKATRDHGCPAWIIGAGANMAFRRSLFDAIGLFDERLDVGRAGCSGDSEYWYRILAAGFTCRYEPTAVVLHHHRLQMDGLASQIFHYMRGHVAALMVQWERTRDIGNLRRAFLSMPFYYARLTVGRVVRGRTNRNRFLAEQARGAVSGLIYYLRQPRPDR